MRKKLRGRPDVVGCWVLRRTLHLDVALASFGNTPLADEVSGRLVVADDDRPIREARADGEPVVQFLTPQPT